MNARLVCLLALLSIAGCRSDFSESTPLETPSIRLVTLAPHLAELVVSAGAEAFLVGVSAYSDFPPSIASIAVVSDGFRIDAEALIDAAPTVVLAWGGGGQASSLALLDELNIPYVTIDSKRLGDIGPAIRQIGKIAGTEETAELAATRFEKTFETLRYSGDHRVSVFYQISESPIYTVNGDHFVSDVIDLCGGTNVFAEVANRVPTVSVESIVLRNPDVILGGLATTGEEALWRNYETMTATRANTLLALPPSVVSRPSARLVEGARAVCDALETARERLVAD